MSTGQFRVYYHPSVAAFNADPAFTQKQRPVDMTLFDSSPAELTGAYPSLAIAVAQMGGDNRHGAHGEFTVIDMSTGLMVWGREIDTIGLK